MLFFLFFLEHLVFATRPRVVYGADAQTGADKKQT